MKKTVTLIAGLCLSAVSFAQLNLTFLDQNNVSCLISDGGLFFNNPAQSLPGYEVPAGAGTYPIYAMSYWIGAQDGGGQLRLAAQRYQGLQDFYHGPLSIGAAEPDANWTPGVFEVTSAEIEDHIANYLTPGYVTPQSILTWPAHGDVGNDFDFYLAPFVDVNFDGAYNPQFGDYPCIRGDRAVYTINHDVGVHLESNGDPLGVEIHSMYYQFDGQGNENNTTFGYVKVINRGTNVLADAKMSLFMDADLGSPMDDYMGTDSTMNLLYTYNGDEIDDLGGSTPGYGENPPAIGLKLLNTNAVNMGNVPSTMGSVLEYWNLMNGYTHLGAPIIDPVTQSQTNFIFSGDPEAQTGSTELLAMVPPGDRRTFATVNLGTLQNNESVEFDFAVIYARGSSGAASSVTALKGAAADIQAFYDAQDFNCTADSIAGLSSLSAPTIGVHPNPTTGELAVNFSKQVDNGVIEVLDASGRVIQTQEISGTQVAQLNIQHGAGVYFLNIRTPQFTATERVIVR